MSHDSHTHFGIPLSEKLKVLPGFFGPQLEEQAPYDILKIDAGVEIRCYRPQTRASTTVRGDYKEAYKEAFNTLAAYLFGNNSTCKKLEMTTPLLLKKESDNEWSMSFILSQASLLKGAPVPDDQRIQLKEYPLQIIASISYGGMSNEEKISEYSGILKQWLKKRPWYIPQGDFQTAQFDGPLTIPFFRKNEIHVEVKQLH